MMVSHINFAVDDDLADRAREIKEEQDWTWQEFFQQAVSEFENGNE